MSCKCTLHFCVFHPVLCGEIAIPHSTREGGVGPYATGQTISLTCDPCYNGGGTMKCLPGGKWDKMIQCGEKNTLLAHKAFSCEQMSFSFPVCPFTTAVLCWPLASVSGMSCGVPPKIPHGDINTSNSVPCGQNVSYSCNKNYVLNGSSELHCTPEGMFHAEAPVCLPSEHRSSVFHWSFFGPLLWDWSVCFFLQVMEWRQLLQKKADWWQLSQFWCKCGFGTQGVVVLDFVHLYKIIVKKVPVWVKSKISSKVQERQNTPRFPFRYN